MALKQNLRIVFSLSLDFFVADSIEIREGCVGLWRGKPSELLQLFRQQPT